MLEEKYYWSEPYQGRLCGDLVKTESIIDDFQVRDVGYYAYKINQEGKCLYFAVLETGRITAPRETLEEIKKIVDEHWGTDTPWGKIEKMRVIYSGVFDVSTKSHSGVMMHIKRVKELLSEDAQKCGSWFNGFLCFEDDRAAHVAFRELLDKGIMDAPINQFYKEGEFSEAINESLKRWNPEYWKAREQRLQKEQKVKQKKLRSREER